MSNPTCLWCGEEMREGVCGDAPVEYVCAGKVCPAEGVMIPPSMTVVPAEIEAWVVEYSFTNVPDSEPIVADWLGYFADEDIALEAGHDAFNGMENAASFFEWEARPTILTFKGGAQ